MSKIIKVLITSGPTREYLDPVRYLTNGSSGRMGVALAEAVLQQGMIPVVVSGPTAMPYPPGSDVHGAETTEQMLQCCLQMFPQCIGVIGAAAPCDFRPVAFSPQKIKKPADGGTALLFENTPDILAALGQVKRPGQWSTAFALETDNGAARAIEKMRQKHCDFVVLNAPESIGRDEASFQVFDASGGRRLEFTGTKRVFAKELLGMLTEIVK